MPNPNLDAAIVAARSKVLVALHSLPPDPDTRIALLSWLANQLGFRAKFTPEPLLRGPSASAPRKKREKRGRHGLVYDVDA